MKLDSKIRKSPKLPWKFQRQANFELANVYESTGEVNKAIAAFNTIIDSSTYALSYVSEASKLHLARLKKILAILTEDQKKEQNPRLLLY